MARMSALVIGMELVAVVVAYLAFGWPVLLVGAPALVGTALVLLAVRAGEVLRRKQEQARAAQWDNSVPVPDGLMSGFFRLPVQSGPAEAPEAARPGVRR